MFFKYLLQSFYLKQQGNILILAEMQPYPGSLFLKIWLVSIRKYLAFIF